MEILHQTQHLDEVAPPGIAHAQIEQSSQPIDTLCQLPALKRHRLVQRPAFMFQLRQIMQRVVDKVRHLLEPCMHGNNLRGTGELDPLNISLDQNLPVAKPRGDRVVFVPVKHQRKRSYPCHHLVAGIIGYTNSMVQSMLRPNCAPACD